METRPTEHRSSLYTFSVDYIANLESSPKPKEYIQPTSKVVTQIWTFNLENESLFILLLVLCALKFYLICFIENKNTEINAGSTCGIQAALRQRNSQDE